MKKAQINFLLLAVLTLCCTQKANAQGVALNNYSDSLSYAIGAEIAKSLATSNIEVNTEVFFAGFRDVIGNKTDRFTPEQIFNVTMRLQQQKHIKRDSIINERRATDIKVEELKEPCDFADAMLICIADMKVILAENIDKKDEEVTEEVKAKADFIEVKMDEIKKTIDDRNLSEEDIKKCDAYKEIENINKEIEDMIKKKTEESESDQ